jgi:ribosomal protein L23
MDARDIIKRPVITEKSTDLMAQNKYTFEVDIRATKPHCCSRGRISLQVLNL